MAAILGGWVRETAWMPQVHSPAQDLEFCRGLVTDARVLVLRLPQVAGFLARSGPVIAALYLAPDARGQGHGGRLLAAATALRLAEGGRDLSLWTFQANHGARRFYSRAGFAEVEWTDGAGNDERLPDVRMIWEG